MADIMIHFSIIDHVLTFADILLRTVFFPLLVSLGFYIWNLPILFQKLIPLFAFVSRICCHAWILKSTFSLYDVLHHVYIDASIQSKIGMNEHKALVSMIDDSIISDRVILIADRG